MCNANTTENVCAGCGLPWSECFYGGDCLEMQYIYRERQREKLRDIDPDEIVCDVCRKNYGETSHDECRFVTGEWDDYEDETYE